jgi:hypothetical protein
MWLRTLGELEAGPIVQTIFVAILAGTGRYSPDILASTRWIADKPRGHQEDRYPSLHV